MFLLVYLDSVTLNTFVCSFSIVCYGFMVNKSYSKVKYRRHYVYGSSFNDLKRSLVDL